MGDISTLFRAWSEGDGNALESLTPIVYGELHRLARHSMRGERPGHSLRATELVNEAYMRRVDYKRLQRQDRSHFFAVSAQLMRHILVDPARQHNLKPGGDVQHVPLDEMAAAGADPGTDLLGLDEAMNSLAKLDSRKAHGVKMRFFGGQCAEENAEARILVANRDVNGVPPKPGSTAN